MPAPQSVDRIFAILGVLASRREAVPLAEIARAIGAPKTSVNSLLTGLAGIDVVSRTGPGTYRVGPGLLALALGVVAGSDLPALVRPVLEDLARMTGETALIGRLAPSGDRAAYVDKVESSNPVRYTVALGEQRELHCTAIGKLLLAWMADGRRRDHLATHALTAFTPATIVDPARLADELAAIRRDGLSTTRGERVASASAMAAPILDRGGGLIAGIVLAGPSDRMAAAWAAHAAAVRRAAARLSAILAGGMPPSGPRKSSREETRHAPEAL